MNVVLSCIHVSIRKDKKPSLNTWNPWKEHKLEKMIKSRNSICTVSSTNYKTVNESKAKESSQKWQNVVAGAAAGAASRLCSAPFDIIKIRRQLDINSAQNTDLLSSMKNIVKSEGGIKGLFRGNVAAMYLWISYAVVQFSLYERTSQFISSYSIPNHVDRIRPRNVAECCLGAIGSSPAATAFVAGGTAGVAATLVSYPFDTCRTIFASKSPPKTLVEYTSRMLQQNGIRGLYAGVMPAVVQIIPYMGINFALYETLVNTEEKKLNPAMAGFLSGGTSKLLIYPLDTIKKRLQAQAFQTDLQYKGMMDCVVTIAREEGILAFYRGMVPTVLKSMVGTGVVFGVYSFTKNILQIDK